MRPLVLPHLDLPETVSAPAAAWLVALETGAGAAAAFHRWRAASPLHALAFARAVALWRALDHLERPAGAAAGDDGRDQGAAPAARDGRVWRRHLLLLAASAAAAALAPLGLWRAAAHAQRLQTEIGERRRWSVAGIAVELDTATRLVCRPTRRGWTLELLRGAVAVTRDAGAPRCRLTVAGARIALAPGRYDARHEGEAGLRLASLRGGAEIKTRGSRTLRLAAGYQLALAGETARVRPLSAAERRALAAWPEGELVFEDAPLARIVGEYNRYLRTPLRLLGSDLGTLRLGGRFLSRDPTVLLRELALNFEIQCAAVDGALLLYRARAGAPPLEAS
ncbi:FecR family protein [Sphingomonas morindae]|uniref:DUF4880 domain-containing protein n=1 Tax=Sphingomonas morindae TaxID=1541170 RepID=A0ABY4X759_9SPHN|nr:DUF4880 domain-containing protein [Sphingomonas morindae]USI72757.1 DUF4880 domain-containing protein [Sphingomonas morindae]